MNAFQPLSPLPSPPEPPRRPAPRVRHRKRRNPHRAIAFEAIAKLGVNGVLAIVAVSTLVKLLPHNLYQQSKLQDLEVEVSDLSDRVDRLQADLNRHFDPQQAMSIMQEQSIRVDPRQRQVVWTDSVTSQVPLQTPQHADVTEPDITEPDIAEPALAEPEMDSEAEAVPEEAESIEPDF